MRTPFCIFESRQLVQFNSYEIWGCKIRSDECPEKAENVTETSKTFKSLDGCTEYTGEVRAWTEAGPGPSRNITVYSSVQSMYNTMKSHSS